MFRARRRAGQLCMQRRARRSSQLVAALVISVTSSVGAQTTMSSDATPAVSMRAGRGHTTVLAGVAITAASTSDGLVEIVAVRDTARLQLRSREPLVTRGVFRPAIIDRWLAATRTDQG